MLFRSRIGGGGVVQNGIGQGVELVDRVGELAERVVDLLPAGQTGIVVVDDGVDVVEGADVVEPSDLAVVPVLTWESNPPMYNPANDSEQFRSNRIAPVCSIACNAAGLGSFS